jgi:hypothetical protein
LHEIVVKKRASRPRSTSSGHHEYNILRDCGVDLVKKDFLGTPRQSLQD